MNIIRIFVKRPVLTTMLVVAFVVLGLYSYQRMVIELMPNVEFPFVIVTTVYPGASPGEVESQITKKVEDAVSTIANVKNLTSYSQENVSQVFIEFQLETDVDLDAIDVKDKVDAIQANLPENAEKSVISKFDFTAFPIIELAMAAPRPLERIYQVADKVVKDRLSRINGVASVDITGKRQREIRVEISPQKLRGYDLSLMDVVGVIAANNLNVPAGHITRGAREITLRMTAEIDNPRKLGDLLLPLSRGRTVPLSEVAKIIDGTEELRESSTYNGEPVIGLSINKRSDGNTVLVAAGVYKALDELSKTLENDDITITITNDTAPFVRAAVSDVLSNVMIGILLTALLLLLFLHNWQQTVVAALSMPISVIATFLLMDQSHFTLNVMSLLALGISIGTLVTNSIVIIENISRFVHLGMDPEEAAVKGTSEVAVAVAASTLTNIVVFTPIAFMSGIIGRFFLQFGLTVVYATIFSVVVSYTIVPMLAARLIKPQASDRNAGAQSIAARIGKKWDKFYDDLSGSYRGVLARVLEHRKRWIAVTVAVFIGAMSLFRFVGGEFMPRIDQNMVVVTMSLPPGTSLDRTKEVSARVADILRAHPEVEGVLVKVGGGQRSVEDAEITAKLVDRSKRKMHVTEFVNAIRPEFAGIPDAEIMLSTEGGATGSAEADLVVDVLSSDQAALEAAADSVYRIFHDVPGLVEIQTSQKAGKPEIAVVPRRHQVADQGLNAAVIGNIMRAAYEGVKAGVYREKGEEYDVKVKYAEADRKDPFFIKDMPLPSRSGTAVPLSDLGDVNARFGESRIMRKDKQRMIEVTANIAAGSLSGVRAVFDRELAKTNLPPSVTVKYSGSAEIQDESFSSIFTALILAIVLLYVVMAAIMESFIHPVTIMLTLPLALVGVAMALFLSGTTVNIFSLMSVVMLTGIVVNNAILMLDYTSQLRNRGMKIKEALLEACSTRLRPIVMANLAIVVGMIPQIFGGAEGSELRTPMAYVQIGGVVVSALLTLFVIPIAYTYLDRLTVRGRKEHREAR
jgi:HAE1 family hydrophobic/amphiphilic exporter-1